MADVSSPAQPPTDPPGPPESPADALATTATADPPAASPAQPPTDPPGPPESPAGALATTATADPPAAATHRARPRRRSPRRPTDLDAPPPPPDDPETDEVDDDDGAGGRMSFLDHLDELRRRLIRAFIALGVGLLICLGFIDPIFDFIMQPLADVLPDGGTLIYTDATEMFFLRLKMAALAGLMVATPVVMSQLWLFVAPGLYAHEKRFAIPFVGLATFFFIGGVLFAHYILFPVAWGFFASFGAESEYVAFTPRLQPAFALYVRLVLACGVVFQLPTVVFFLARMGVASPRFLLRNFKYAVLLIFIFAAIITPTPDPVTMTFMAGPMLMLYLLSIGIAWVFQKRRSDEE